MGDLFSCGQSNGSNLIALLAQEEWQHVQRCSQRMLSPRKSASAGGLCLPGQYPLAHTTLADTVSRATIYARRGGCHFLRILSPSKATRLRLWNEIFYESGWTNLY